MNKNTVKGFIGGVLLTSVLAGTGFTYAATNGFTDVPAGQWYTNAVQWAKDNKVMNGTGSNTFSPDKPMTRAEFAAAVKNLYDAGFLNNPNQTKTATGDTYQAPTTGTTVSTDNYSTSPSN